jgi:hypothetical protein
MTSGEDDGLEVVDVAALPFVCPFCGAEGHVVVRGVGPRPVTDLPPL